MNHVCKRPIVFDFRHAFDDNALWRHHAELIASECTRISVVEYFHAFAD